MSSESETANTISRSKILDRLRATPARTAILTDVDGTLAPIVERPADAEVPARARELLEALSGRFALLGCISGRQAEEARALVGVNGIAYAGNHGLELLLPGEEVARLGPSLGEGDGGNSAAGKDGGAGGGGLSAADFVSSLDRGTLEDCGLRMEDKGPIQALHWRGAEDEEAAEARAREIAAAATQAGLRPHWGRKVLELRPPTGGGKDAAVSALLAGGGISVVAYAGDDRTDLDAFRRLRELRDEGVLETAVCIGVGSAEAPAALAEQADLVVNGPAGWLEILESLLE